MDFTRFRGHYLLHDRGAPEEAARMAEIMAARVGNNYEFFKQPQPPYGEGGPSVLEWLRSRFLPGVLNSSVIFGFGLGGLLAAKLQEEFPAKRLSVVAINAPCIEEGISLAGSVVSNRVAIYSSGYTPIAGRCEWGQYTAQAYDLPWLQHGIKNAKYGLAYLLTSYMQVECLAVEVASFRFRDELLAAQ